MTLAQFLSTRQQHQRGITESWRQTRMMVHSMAMIMGGKKSVESSLTKFMPLPFDEDFEPKKPTEQQDIDNMALIQQYKDLGYLKPLAPDGKRGTDN